MHTLLENFKIRTSLLGTALCTSHYHTPAKPVEMPFGEEKASQGIRSPAKRRSALIISLHKVP